MDIHKPKPWHGWREFLKEYVIIVVGVLTALGAEQFAASIHDARLADETRATAHAELTQALDRYRSRLPLEPCIDRRLEEFGHLLATAGDAGYIAPAWIGRPQFWGFNSSGWDAATQGGRTALLHDAERTRLGAIYGQLRDLSRLEQEEQRAWADLRQMEDQQRLDPQTLAVVRSALQQARLANWNVRVDVAQALANARGVGIHFDGAAAKASPSICLPTNTPRAEAVAQINRFFGDQLGEP